MAIIVRISIFIWGRTARLAMLFSGYLSNPNLGTNNALFNMDMDYVLYIWLLIRI